MAGDGEGTWGDMLAFLQRQERCKRRDEELGISRWMTTTMESFGPGRARAESPSSGERSPSATSAIFSGQKESFEKERQEATPSQRARAVERGGQATITGGPGRRDGKLPGRSEGSKRNISTFTLAEGEKNAPPARRAKALQEGSKVGESHVSLADMDPGGRGSEKPQRVMAGKTVHKSSFRSLGDLFQGDLPAHKAGKSPGQYRSKVRSSSIPSH